MILDILRIFRREPSAPGFNMPSPREIEGLRLLRDEQLRWYLSQHGQACLRRELERRAGR